MKNSPLDKIQTLLVVVALVATIATLTLAIKDHRDYFDAEAASNNQAINDRFAVVDKFIAGEEVDFNKVRDIFVAGAFAMTAENWCIRHNVPKEERPAVVAKLASAMYHAKIKIGLPDQPEGEPS